MKNRFKKNLWLMFLVGALAVMGPGRALALGTDACTVVTNNAKLTFSVGGTAQPFVDTTGAPAEFTVGNKVILTVEKIDGAAVTVVPNSVATDTVLSFTVTNTGNAIQDYSLAVFNDAGEADPFLGVADSFDLDDTTPGVEVFVETDGIVGYLPADNATSINNLDPAATRANELQGSVTVYLVPTSNAALVVPAALLDGVQSVYTLEATSLKGDGTAEANSIGATIFPIGGGASCSAAVQFAEDIHTNNRQAAPGEAKWDGKDTARNTYKVSTATIAITKTDAVIWDPINYNTGPKTIPGAIVEYTVTIQNTGGADAVLTTISDLLDITNLTMVTALFDTNLNTATPLAGTGNAFDVTCTAPCGARACIGGTAFTSAADGDGITFATPTITATMATVLPSEAAGACPAGQIDAATGEVVIKFQATIN